ncbi:hypothetical protein WJM97_07150 [Okeanomitos corallinicola TIOX110]|uniref:Alpha/beta hydrolase n=1 Tax=Okeanomitos corallinicola TIOX110 TaxID=3133117 RepID=A0ABZ2UWX6_9CYAN
MMSDLSQMNIVNIGLNGTFRETGEQHTQPRDIDSLFEHLSATRPQKIVLYFHGGLVNEQNGRETAERMTNLFQEEAYPVAFVWKTGFKEILQQKLNAIYNSGLFKKVEKYVSFRSSNHLSADIKGGGHRGAGQAMTVEEIERELQQENPFQQFDEVARQGAGQLNQPDLKNIYTQLLEELQRDLDQDQQFTDLLHNYTFEDLSPPELAGIEERETELEQRRGGFITLRILATVAFNVIKRYWQKRDHGYYPTVVEETLRTIYANYFGKFIWDQMKNKAKGMWQPNQGEINGDSYVGTYFLEKLVSLKQQRPELIIDLVGHSAGTICICHLINAINERYSDLKIRNVLFMAPACTSDLFYENIVTKTNLYQNFRMFTMGDGLEIRDSLVPGIYTRSLLYFISGVLEDTADKPIAGLEFHLNRQSSGEHNAFENYGDDDRKLRAIRSFLTQDSNRLVLSPTTTANPGLNSNSGHHGDFDSDETTLQSLRAIISS